MGDSRVCVNQIVEDTNRGLQCIFGALPPVHAYLLKVGNPTLTLTLTKMHAYLLKVGTAAGTEWRMTHGR